MSLTDAEIDDGSINAEASASPPAEAPVDLLPPQDAAPVKAKKSPKSAKGGLRRAADAAKATRSPKQVATAKKPAGKATKKPAKVSTSPSTLPMVDPASSSDHSLRITAQLIRLAGDPTRLRILGELESGSRSVSDLVEIAGNSQPAVSHHLCLMKLSGLIIPTRAGKSNVYALTPNGYDVWKFARELIERHTAG